MTIKLDMKGSSQLRTLRRSTANDMVSMCREIGEDPATYFESEDWSGLDLRGCDLNGVSFKGAVMDRVTITPEQEQIVRASNPRSMDDVLVDESLHEAEDIQPPENEAVGDEYSNEDTLDNALFDTKIFTRLRLGLRLSSKDATRAVQRGTPLKKANLGAPVVKDANRFLAKLIGAHINEVDLSQANLREANLRKANLRKANLRKADLYRANLSEANLQGAELVGAKLIGAELTGAELTRAGLIGAELIGADFFKANLTGANLFKTDLTGAVLREANLNEAELREANLRETDLREANLFRAKLYEANLYGANLTEANLYEANLHGAHLYGANLHLSLIHISEPTRPY